MNLSRPTAIVSLLALGLLPGLAAGCAADASSDPTGQSEASLSVGAPVATPPVANPPVSTSPISPPPVVAPIAIAPVARVTDSGAGWQRMTISGTTIDDLTAAPVVVDGEYWVIQGRSAIPNVKLPAKTAAALTDSMNATPVQDGDNELIFFPTSASASIEAGTAPVVIGGLKAQYSCSDTSGLLSKTYNFSEPYSTTKSTDGNGFTGTANLNATVGGSLEGAVSYTIKKVWCIPYPVIHSVTVGGSASVTAGATVTGSFSKPWSTSTTLASPVLGTITLPIIPIPITFALPVKVGLDASAAASVNTSASVTAGAGFDVTCASSGCTGSKYASAGFTPNTTPTFSASGRVLLTPWAEVDLEAYILSGSLLNAQVGVRAGMPNDLFNYSGNTCGDADGDGKAEVVSGATIDTSVDVSLRASASILGSTVANDSWDLWHTHVGFWTVYDDGLLDPMFYSAPHNGTGTVTMEGRMRPCWPYTDAMSYVVTWSDATATPVTDPPATVWSEAHNIGYGFHNVTVEATSDAAGRSLGTTATRREFMSPIVVINPGLPVSAEP